MQRAICRCSNRFYVFARRVNKHILQRIKRKPCAGTVQTKNVVLFRRRAHRYDRILNGYRSRRITGCHRTEHARDARSFPAKHLRIVCTDVAVFNRHRILRDDRERPDAACLQRAVRRGQGEVLHRAADDPAEQPCIVVPARRKGRRDRMSAAVERARKVDARIRAKRISFRKIKVGSEKVAPAPLRSAVPQRRILFLRVDELRPQFDRNVGRPGHTLVGIICSQGDRARPGNRHRRSVDREQLRIFRNKCHILRPAVPRLAVFRRRDVQRERRRRIVAADFKVVRFLRKGERNFIHVRDRFQNGYGTFCFIRFAFYGHARGDGDFPGRHARDHAARDRRIAVVRRCPRYIIRRNIRFVKQIAGGDRQCYLRLCIYLRGVALREGNACRDQLFDGDGDGRRIRLAADADRCRDDGGTCGNARDHAVFDGGDGEFIGRPYNVFRRDGRVGREVGRRERKRERAALRKRFACVRKGDGRVFDENGVFKLPAHKTAQSELLCLCEQCRPRCFGCFAVKPARECLVIRRCGRSVRPDRRHIFARRVDEHVLQRVIIAPCAVAVQPEHIVLFRRRAHRYDRILNGYRSRRITGCHRTEHARDARSFPAKHLRIVCTDVAVFNRHRILRDDRERPDAACLQRAVRRGQGEVLHRAADDPVEQPRIVAPTRREGRRDRMSAAVERARKIDARTERISFRKIKVGGEYIILCAVNAEPFFFGINDLVADRDGNRNGGKRAAVQLLAELQRHGTCTDCGKGQPRVRHGNGSPVCRDRKRSILPVEIGDRVAVAFYLYREMIGEEVLQLYRRFRQLIGGAEFRIERGKRDVIHVVHGHVAEGGNAFRRRRDNGISTARCRHGPRVGNGSNCTVRALPHYICIFNRISFAVCNGRGQREFFAPINLLRSRIEPYHCLRRRQHGDGAYGAVLFT